LEEGFFDKPRSPRDVKQKFEEAGVNFTDSGVRAILRRLSLAGVLETVKKVGQSVIRRNQSEAVLLRLY